MAEIINGKLLAKNIKSNLKEQVDLLKKDGIDPKLAVILVGNDAASKVYVKNKNKACEVTGVLFEEYMLDENTTMKELLKIINELNNRDDVNGILLQSPLPKHLDINIAFREISPEKDVDGFNPINVGKLSLGQDTFVACTPYGVMRMLDSYGIDVQGKNAVIIGRSNIVGKPLIQCLLSKNATVTVCHSKTQNIKDITKGADVVIAALGKPKFVTEDMIKKDAVVIDVGINRTDDGKLVGDVDFDSVSKKASYITPVPGGVGPMTIAMLMENVVKATKQQKLK